MAREGAKRGVAGQVPGAVGKAGSGKGARAAGAVGSAAAAGSATERDAGAGAQGAAGAVAEPCVPGSRVAASTFGAPGALSPEFFAAREAELRRRVSAKRFAHVQGVVRMAERLARAYGVDVPRARLAALLHDWDKGYDDPGIRARAREVGADVDPWVAEHMPRLLHGPTAACALRCAHPGIPREVLVAIERHTTGAPDMGDLDMVLYVADALEEGRTFGRVEELRGRIGRESLEELFVDVLGYWTILIIEAGKPLHPDTVGVWNAYVMKRQKPFVHGEERA